MGTFGSVSDLCVTHTCPEVCGDAYGVCIIILSVSVARSWTLGLSHLWNYVLDGVVSDWK